jgi:hypothetical protein
MVYFFITVVGIFLVLLLTAIFQWLWNITMPVAFGLRPIAFWVAFRLWIIGSAQKVRIPPTEWMDPESPAYPTTPGSTHVKSHQRKLGLYRTERGSAGC